MNTNKHELMTPDLRFPEFTGEWVEKRLGEVSKIASGGTPNRQTPNFWNGDIPWVTTTQIKFNEITSAAEFITDEGLRNSSAKLFPKGTLLIALYGQGITRGKVAVLGIDATTNQACASIQLDKSRIETSFTFYDLQRRYEQIRNLSNDGGQKNLSAGLVKSIACVFPAVSEQKKIAGFLSSVDGRIEGLEKKRELLKEYKKGLMQKLFNQSLRFMDDTGNPFPDWEEKTFEKVFCSLPSKKFQIKSSDVLQKGDIPVVDQGQGVIAGYSDGREKLFSNIPVIIFGDHTTILKFVDFPFVVGADGTKLLQGVDQSDLKYLFYYLSHANVEQEGYKRHFSILKKIKIQLPSLEEQQKIADCLSAVDRKIGQVEVQVGKTKAFKQGLLQKMFV